jgi:hypothetical protein
MDFGDFFRWGLLLQAIALIHFARRRPEGFWLMVIVFLGGLGAAIYIVVEVVPDLGLLRGVLDRFARRRRITTLEAVVRENSAAGNVEELADLLLEERQFARARGLYDQVISPRTDDLDPFYRRGICALELKDAAAAVPDFERVVAKDPKYDFNRAIGLMGQAYALTNQPDKADAAFQAALDKSTLSETELNYASFLAAQGRHAEARAIAQRMLDRKHSIPRYLQRRERPWFRKAKSILKKLPKA